MSSKRAIRRRACTGKKRHATLADAAQMAGGGMMAYRCQFCGGFHIGHPPLKMRKIWAERG